MIGKGLLIESRIELTVKEYKKNIIENCGGIHPKQLEFAEGLIRLFYEYDKEQIYVNSNRCGMGKSTLLKAFLNNLVNDNMWMEPTLSGYGAIIIHDSLAGLENIATYEGLENKCYFMRYDKTDDDNRTKANSRTEFTQQLKEQSKYPVVLMTTQKYFKMNKQERKLLYNWDKGKRVIKIIDEKPYVISTTTIDEKYLADISISLEGLPKSEIKDFIVDSWESIKTKLHQLKKSYSKYETMWIKSSEQPLLLTKSEDKKFFSLLDTEQCVSANLYDKIKAIKSIFSDGCLFEASSNKDQDNSRKFTLISNNLDKFDLDKCGTFVLDATSKFDTDYQLEGSFDVHRFDDKKDQSDITVHHIKTSTSQNTLIKNDRKAIDTICKWGNQTFADGAFVATYSDKRGIYQSLYDGLESKNIAYFGDIKGKNDWESYETMAHIGLNRKSNTVYLQKYIVLKNKITEWNSMEDDTIQIEIQELLKTEKGLFVDEHMDTIMQGDIVVDTIQNVMRIKCRHFNNTQNCNIFIVCSGYYYSIVSKVNDAIGGKYIPDIPDVFLEAKINNRQTEKESLAQKIVRQWNDMPFENGVIDIQKIYEFHGIKKEQLDKAKEKNKTLKQLLTFKRLMIDGKTKRGKYVA